MHRYVKHLLAAHNRLSERTELETGIPRESWLALLRERYCQPDLSMSSETESLWKHVVTTQEWEVLSQLLEVQLPQLNTSPLWIELTIILVTFIAPSTYTFVAASLRLPASSSS